MKINKRTIITVETIRKSLMRRVSFDQDEVACTSDRIEIKDQIDQIVGNEIAKANGDDVGNVILKLISK